ncbi:MAG: PRC-barrel domain-containing protein [Phycisphaerae bacterium]|nr:PRC-barrel domain-containing protein [Phycisphaerae bacterium]NNF41771.1 PRC-barrel domain-containing protein [Phycisphaerales bacterium]
MTTTTMTPSVISASTIIGDTVKSLTGEKLGSIKEIMLDTSTGQVAYAVLDFGGFLGLGGKLFAVPWNALTVCPEDKCLKMDANKERLENAEGFDPDNWPNFADRRWGERVHSYYRTRPYWS